MLGCIKLGQLGDCILGNGYVTTLQALDCSVRQENCRGGWYVAAGFSSGIVFVIRLGHRSEERYGFCQPHWYPFIGSPCQFGSLFLAALCVCVLMLMHHLASTVPTTFS